ncbi:MAG: hypothetical protein AAGL90_15395 [Pseudomonadota bacterium]
MSYRALLSAIALSVLGFGGGVSAQIESDSLDDISAWGQRFLASGEPEFPTSLWRNSNDEVLLALLQSVRTDALGPAERRLLRRLVLSPAARPSGDLAEAMLVERARLILELGESRAAAALAAQLEPGALLSDTEARAVDIDLAGGQEATACGALNGPIKDGEYWMKLRAVCAALQDNFSGAQLAIEFATGQGVNDAWLVEAIFAASGDAPDPPPARFDTGLNIALSLKAGLDASDAVVEAPLPDLAAAAARHPALPLRLRADFAKTAAAFDRIDSDTRRNIVLNQFEDATYEPRSALEQALNSLNDPLTGDQQRMQDVAIALDEAAAFDPFTYRSTARLFVSDLAGFQQTRISQPFALGFARAAMIADDPDLAMMWLSALEPEIDPPTDPAPEEMEIVDLVSGPDPGAATDAAEPAPEPEMAALEPVDPYPLALLEAVAVLHKGDVTAAQRQDIERRLIDATSSIAREEQVATTLNAWTGFGIPISAIGRDFIVQVADRGERLAQGSVTSLKAAVLADAIAETGLSVLVSTNGDADRLAAIDQSILFAALIALDTEDIARELAVESTQFWRDVE